MTAGYSNSSWNLTDLADGTYKIKIWNNDSVNNINNTAVFNITIDRTAPVLSLSSSAAATSLDLTVSASDTTGLNGTCTTDRGTISGFVVSESGLTCATSYTYNITCYDFMGSLGNITQSFSTSNCGSSTSSSGSSTTEWYVSYYPLANELASLNGYNTQLILKGRAVFKVGNENHQLGIVKLDATNKQVVMNISSKTQQATFSIGDEKKFDVNEDGYYDLYVKLNNITVSAKADITMKAINEKISSSLTTGSGNSNTPAEETQEKSGKTSNLLKILGWAIILALIATGIYYIYLYYKKKDY